MTSTLKLTVKECEILTKVLMLRGGELADHLRIARSDIAIRRMTEEQEYCTDLAERLRLERQRLIEGG